MSFGSSGCADASYSQHTYICLPRLHQSAAEQALVDLWMLWEKHGLSTPGLIFKFTPNNEVCITLIVEDSLRAILETWVMNTTGAI